MEYNFRETEKKWQQFWADKKIFKAENNSSREKFYVLDMFPYPSGAGLHVGHPLGYIASDIYARYKRLKGFNVLHPMGWDAFGLPAEQYAIQTGQHPAITTEQNIKRYREQMDKIGFSFDWDREIKTSDPQFYKWTQWIFLKLFNSWYNPETDKAEAIEKLIQQFEINNSKSEIGEWKSLNEKQRSDVLMSYRLAYLSDAMVNWCPQLGTVLANDEVKDGVSERGGYPVERKLMKQWSLRITAYAERLLNDLDAIDWSESIKDQQRNWIGKSEGASVRFMVYGLPFAVEIFTTRPDTIFGATYMTLAPEHELVEKITTTDRKEEVIKYVEEATNRSERERMTEVKRISGVFTGAYAEHPFTKKQIPIWVGDYVLAGYGTGAVMAVPAHDSRDYAFATHFNLPIVKVIEPPAKVLPIGEALGGVSYDEKEGTLINSYFLNGLEVKDAIKKAIEEIERRNIGKGKINFRLRDAIFGRQRYWGEPIPIYYENGIPKAVDENDLPVILPEVDKYLPTEDGEPPLARATNWKYKNQFEFETTTMPGWAGSSWYFLRYMDPNNENEFVSADAVNYWKDVDLYIGGAEHATGHLLYVRFWTKFLFDLGLIPVIEPAKKLINQGMIQGVSSFVYRIIFQLQLGDEKLSVIETESIFSKIKQLYISKGYYEELENQWTEFWTYDPSNINIPDLREYINKKTLEIKNVVDKDYKIVFDNINTRPLNVDISIVDKNNKLDIEKFKASRAEYEKMDFLLEDSDYFCGSEVEKMSKSKLNVVNPDDIIEKYGADCLRMYEMFLGPLEQSKPWNTNGISGVSNFIRKMWRLYHSTGSQQENNSTIQQFNNSTFHVSEDAPDKKELKSLHKLIKKVTEDIERFSFNTSVSNFMICVNELTDLKCNKRAILEPLAILISPYAPHIAEMLWAKLKFGDSFDFENIPDGFKGITREVFPMCNEEYLAEDSFAYPISLNGKTKFNLDIPLSLTKEEIEKEVMNAEDVKKLLQGQPPKKIIVVPGRIVNIVI